LEVGRHIREVIMVKKFWAKTTAILGASLMVVSLGAITASASTLSSRFATYQVPSSSPTGTITLPAGYPQATITTTVGNVSTSSVDPLVRSPFKTFFTAGGTAGTSSPALSLQGGQTSSQTPNVITITFDRAIPANHLGMNLGDVDVETVVIEMAQDLDGTLTPLTPAQMGFQETYNSTTSGTDVPVKTSDDDANTITLTGTGSDTNGASAWFIPETSVTQITLTSQITSFGRFYLWFAAIRPEATITPLVTTYQAQTDPLEEPFAEVSFPAGIDATAFGEEDQAITYQVLDDGGTGCELSTTTPVTLTATTGGTCQLTATVADADGFIGQTEVFDVTVGKPIPVIVWEPEETSFPLNDAPTVVTPEPPAPAPGGGDYTFTKDDTSSTSDCTVEAATGAITVSAAGTCVVAATSAETDQYASGVATATFTFKLVPVVEWAPEVTEFEVTEFPFTTTPPPPPPSPSGEAYTFTKDDTSTSDCTVDEGTSTLVVPQPGTCVVGASTPETDDFAAHTVTTTYTFTGAIPEPAPEPELAATGTGPTPLWALVMAAVGVGVLALSRRFGRSS